LRGDSKRAAVELRKQRRAHGVAAIHASLDKRLQAIFHAWSVVARDVQRESMYQRQLDIAAAESAASCAVLRMEGRRNTLELRVQRRAQALKAIASELRHWTHATFQAWASVAAKMRQDDFLMQQMGATSSQAATACAQARHRSRELERWRGAHLALLERGRLLQLSATVLAAWAWSRQVGKATVGTSQACELRKRALPWGTSVVQLFVLKFWRTSIATSMTPGASTHGVAK